MLATKALTAEELKGTIFELLHQIAPEAHLDGIDPNMDMRGALDIDSLDYLTFLIVLNEKVHVNVQETDCSQLTTLNGLVACLLAYME